MKQVVCVCLALCLAFFVGCAVEPRFAGYETLPGSEYLAYLAMKREDVIKAFDISADTWSFFSNDEGVFSPHPYRNEPVELNGEDYTLHFNFTQGPEADSQSYLIFYYFDRTIKSEDLEEKRAEVKELYNLFCEELGEPETQYSRAGVGPGPRYISTALEQGFDAQNYTEKWVLAEHVAWPDIEEDINVVLLLTLTAHLYPGGLDMEVEYRLQDSSYTGLARYPQKSLSEQYN